MKEVLKESVHKWEKQCIKVEDFMYARYIKPPEPAAFVEVGCNLEEDSGEEILLTTKTRKKFGGNMYSLG